MKFEPGAIYQVETPTALVVTAMNKTWTQQKAYAAELDSIESRFETDTEQVEAMIELIVANVESINGKPATAETIANHMDRTAIYQTAVSIRYNLKADEKKSSE